MSYKMIDIDQALHQLGGSEKLYKTVVTGFYDKYQHVDETIQSLLDASEHEDARRLAHSIKGLSGNLGAASLRQKALELELAIKENQDAINATLQAFSQELEAVILEVKDILATRYSAMAQTSKTILHREDQFLEAAKSLNQALGTYRFGDVKKSLSALEQVKIPEKYHNDLHKITTLINEYDYDLASVILRKLTEE